MYKFLIVLVFLTCSLDALARPIPKSNCGIEASPWSDIIQIYFDSDSMINFPWDEYWMTEPTAEGEYPQVGRIKGPGKEGHGTGFFVEDGHGGKKTILTAAHVFFDIDTGVLKKKNGKSIGVDQYEFQLGADLTNGKYRKYKITKIYCALKRKDDGSSVHDQCEVTLSKNIEGIEPLGIDYHFMLNNKHIDQNDKNLGILNSETYKRIQSEHDTAMINYKNILEKIEQLEKKKKPIPMPLKKEYNKIIQQLGHLESQAREMVSRVSYKSVGYHGFTDKSGFDWSVVRSKNICFEISEEFSSTKNINANCNQAAGDSGSPLLAKNKAVAISTSMPKLKNYSRYNYYAPIVKIDDLKEMGYKTVTCDISGCTYSN